MRPRRSLLPWIVAFKAVKSTTLLGLGVTLLVTRHTDPRDLIVRLALDVHLPLTSAAFERAGSRPGSPFGSRWPSAPRRSGAPR